MTSAAVHPAPRQSIADDRVLRHAPLLRFGRDETHFPIDPAVFVQRSRLVRYGWSETVRDAVWHPRRACWETTVSSLPPSPDAIGPDIVDACRLIQFEARTTGTDARNRRPCDPANLWYGRRTGYALELADPMLPELRGRPGTSPALYYDRYSVPTHAGVFDVISYWFCFALSRHALAHEGDWVALSVLHDDAARTMRYRFDAPRGGMVVDADAVEHTAGHPHVYVETGSHGFCRSASELDYDLPAGPVVLSAWELEPRRIPTLAWSSFDGAWGRIGAGPRTSGPLGPLFRRLDAAGVLAA